MTDVQRVVARHRQQQLQAQSDDASSSACNCWSNPARLLPATALVTGALFALAWWLAGDAAAFAVVTDDPQPVTGWFMMPGVANTLAFWVIVTVPAQYIAPAAPAHGLDHTPEEHARSRLFACILVGGIILSLASVFFSVVIWAAYYVSITSVAASVYPGIALMLQNVLLFGAAMLLRLARSAAVAV